MVILILIGFFQWILVTAYDTDWSKVKCLHKFKDVDPKFNTSKLRTTNVLRVIGGEEVKPHTLPYHVGILTEGHYYCAGSLISEYYVLTTAHCFQTPGKVKVMLGAHRIEEYEASQMAIVVTQKELPYPAILDEYIRPVKVETNINTPHSSAVLCGWGVTCEKTTAPFLKKIEVDILDYEICREIYGVGNSSSRICTSIGGCNGDSGGPLVSNGVQIGILSFGNVGCDLPSVLTKVSFYIDWIMEHINR